jgi:protein SCO1/2
MRRALTAALVLLAGCDIGGFRGMAVDPPRELPGFRFAMADGGTFDTAPERGRPMALFFGYTHCPDVCPTTLADFVRVRRALGADADRVRFVFVSVDPERDTPAIAERYAGSFHPTFVGVAGDSTTTDAIQRAFGVATVKEPGSEATGYLVSHASQVFLLDDRGRLAAIHPFGSGWDALAADLKRLL